MKTARRTSGFTLIELLMVISILGLIAGMAIPAIKNLGKSNVNASAGRQLLDDIARARQLAISGHTTVFMIFAEGNCWTNIGPNISTLWTIPAVTNLVDKEYTGYTFVSLRTVGDQPGHDTLSYLAPWQNLPQGNFIALWKFYPRAVTTFFQDTVDNRTYNIPGFQRTSANFIPFPAINAPGTATNLPYIAFNYLGQLTTEQLSPQPSQQDEYIPLAQGTVFPPTDPTSKALVVSASNFPQVTEVPAGNSTNWAYNVIHIDWLTGRAREEAQQLK